MQNWANILNQFVIRFDGRFPVLLPAYSAGLLGFTHNLL
jgi:hypothetical protein